MAKVQAQVIGGDIKQVEVGTVGDLKRQLNVPTHAATVNGNPVQDGYSLKDYEFVSLAPAVKGA